MIASALFMVVLATALTAVVEANRGVNTVAARTSDAATAEPVLNLLARQVRAATGAALECTSSSATSCTGGSGAGSDPYTELWLASASTTSWPYTCTIWAYESNTGNLDAFASSSAVSLNTIDPKDLLLDATNGTDGLKIAAHLAGVNTMASGSSGIFQDFTGYPGLVDVSMASRYSTSASQSDLQMGTQTPVMLEIEADDTNVPYSSVGTSLGLPAFSTSSPYYPSSSCY
jgi:hypothetical protein